MTILPAECFVACNQFFVPQDNAMQFESRWRNRTTRLVGCNGFVSFDLLRRGVKAKGHDIAPVGDDEPSYMTCTIWRDRVAFEGWRTGSAFREAHGSGRGSKEKGGGAAAEAARSALVQAACTRLLQGNIGDQLSRGPVGGGILSVLKERFYRLFCLVVCLCLLNSEGVKWVLDLTIS